MENKILNYEDAAYKISCNDGVITVYDKRYDISFEFTRDNIDNNIYVLLRHLIAHTKYPSLLSPRQMIKELGISPTKLRMIRQNKCLDYIKLSDSKNATIKYSIDALLDFYDSCKNVLKLDAQKKISKTIAKRMIIEDNMEA